MKHEVTAALTEYRQAGWTAESFVGSSLEEFRWCNGISFALGLLKLILEKTSRWNVVVRWVLGSVIDGIARKLEEECADGLP